MRLRATHYVRRSPEPDVWVPLTFVTRDVTGPSGDYFLGFETYRPISAEDVAKREAHGTVQRLPWPAAIEKHQALWLSPNEDVWLADSTNPLGDKQKVLLERKEARRLVGDVWARGRRVSTLSASEIAKTIVDTGDFPWADGDYLTSKRKPNRREIYQPVWQGQTRTLALNRLRDMAREIDPRKSINTRHLTPLEHYYPDVEQLIAERKVVLPFEMIFETPSRRELINVVQLANVSHLALVYDEGSAIQQEMELRPDEEYTGTADEWLARVRGAQARLCAHSHTAAYHFVADAAYHNKLDPHQVERDDRIDRLAAWFGEGTRAAGGLVACDVGIAYRLVDLNRSLRMSLVPYDEQIPVGIAFKRTDQAWGRFLEEVIADVMKSPSDQIAASIEDTKRRCAELCMEWVYDNARAA